MSSLLLFRSIRSPGLDELLDETSRLVTVLENRRRIQIFVPEHVLTEDDPEIARVHAREMLVLFQVGEEAEEDIQGRVMGFRELIQDLPEGCVRGVGRTRETVLIQCDGEERITEFPEPDFEEVCRCVMIPWFHIHFSAADPFPDFVDRTLVRSDPENPLSFEASVVFDRLTQKGNDLGHRRMTTDRSLEHADVRDRRSEVHLKRRRSEKKEYVRTRKTKQQTDGDKRNRHFSDRMNDPKKKKEED